MQHTTNYNFSQYDATDRVTRDAFNADNFAIDAALKSVSDAAGTAQSTATTAQSTADAALAAAQAAAAAAGETLLKTVSPASTTSGNWNIDLSDIDLSAWRTVRFHITLVGTGGWRPELRANGVQAATVEVVSPVGNRAVIEIYCFHDGDILAQGLFWGGARSSSPRWIGSTEYKVSEIDGFSVVGSSSGGQSFSLTTQSVIRVIGAK